MNDSRCSCRDEASLSPKARTVHLGSHFPQRPGRAPPTADLWPEETRTKVVFLVFWEGWGELESKGESLAGSRP